MLLSYFPQNAISFIISPFFWLNNTLFTNNMPKFKYQLGRLKVNSEISCGSPLTLHCGPQCTILSLIPHVMPSLGTKYSHECI